MPARSPPATSTRPVGRTVAVGPNRAFVSAGPATNVFDAASKRSVVASAPRIAPVGLEGFAVPPATSAPPSGSAAAAWKLRMRAMHPTAAVDEAAGVTASAEQAASTSRRST